jgi:uncharacterized membrane protein
MTEIKDAKMYGGIGALLLLVGGVIPTVGSLVSIIGLILIFIGVKKISEITSDKELFRNFLYSFLLMIVAMVTLFVFILIGFGSMGGISWLTSLETANITDFASLWSYFSGIIVAVILGLFVAWIFAVVGSIYLRRSYKSIAQHTGVHLFETTGKLYFYGSITAIVIVGFFILFIARILEIVSFFSLPDILPLNGIPTGSQRVCPNCGRVIPEDANICPYCSRNF